MTVVAAVGAAVATSGAPRTSVGVSLAPHGSLVYLCGAGYSNLCRMSLETRQVVRLTSDGGSTAFPGGAYRSPSLSADGRMLAFAFDGKAIVGDGMARHRRVVAAGGVEAVALRRDGRKLLTLTPKVYCPTPTSDCYSTYRVATVDLRTQAARSSPVLVSDAAWLAADTLVAVRRDRLERYRINGCCRSTVLERPGLRDPATAPDGARVALSTETGTADGARLAIATVAGGALSFVLPPRRRDQQVEPAWSRDGRWLVFVDRRVTTEGGQRYRIPYLTLAAASGGSRRSLGVRGLSPTWGG